MEEGIMVWIIREDRRGKRRERDGLVSGGGGSSSCNTGMKVSYVME